MNIERLCILVALITLTAGCTLEDGEPWGHVDIDLAAEEPSVGEAFELTSWEVELEELHLLSTGGEPVDETDGDCHGDHCHGAPAEEPGDQPSAREIAHFEISEPLTAETTVSLGAEITERGVIDRVEGELHSLVVEGTLTREEEEIPTTIHLEHLPLAGALDAHFGPGEPEHQHLELTIHMPADWLHDVHLDELEVGEDGRIVIDHESNHEAAEAITRHLETMNFESHVSHEH